MADKTLTVNGQPFTFNRDKFAGVRTMTVNGETVTVDRTAQVIDSDRKGESRPLLSKVVGGAAAAYSLRDLNDKQGNNKVVRVRRASDNHERDFVAKEVSNGTLTDWVNTQVVAPLDLKALTATGRDGAYQIAKAAYSLRSLGTRQATLAATGDTVARANGKFVAQVRRPSDDALKSFTAAEVTDGTLRNFCLNDDTDIISFADAGLAGSPAASKRMYFDGASNRVESNTTVDESSDFFIKTNVVWLGNRDEVIFTDRGSSERLVNVQVHSVNDKVRVQVQTSTGFSVPITSTSDLPKFQVVEVMLQHTASTKTLELFFDGVSQGSGNYTGTSTPANRSTVEIGSETNGNRLFTGIISDFNYNNETIQLGYGNTNADWEDTVGSNNGTVAGSPALFTGQGFDGFVKTWYDQSVDAGGGAHGNHAVQATAGSQPKIVNAGSLLADGIEFDGSDDTLTAASVSGFGATISMFEASVRDGGGAAVVSMGSSASTANTNFGIVEGSSVTQASVRNTTSRTVNASVSGSTRLGFSVTTGKTSTKVGTLGGTLVETTDDYGNDFTSGELDTIFLGKLRAGSGSTFNGHIREAIIYDTDQTDNRTAIEANIGEAYSIDLPSGVDPGFDQVDGFVETWYDQSGNSKDAIQTTANLQPAIVVAGVFQNGLKFDSDGSSSGPDFRTPISSAQLSNDPAGHSGFALVWVGNVNQVQHADTSNHSVLGNLRNVQSFPTGTIGLSVIPKTGTTKFINEQGGSTSETVQDTNALTPGDFGVVFFSFEDAESGLDPLLSVDGSTTTSSLNSLNSSSSNNIGIMTAINSNNTIRYDRSADGICKEVILYTGDQKSKRAALETNIAAEYGITLS